MKRALAAAVIAALAVVPGTGTADHETGVGPTEITIGLLVTQTGASPEDATALGHGDLYWRYLHEVLGVTVHGRTVRLDIRDDQGHPDRVRTLCPDLATQALLVVGRSAPRVTAECSARLGALDVPYLVGGTTDSIWGTGRSESSYPFAAGLERRAEIAGSYTVHVLGAEADRYGHVPLQIPIVEIEIPLIEVEAPDGVVVVGLVRPDDSVFDGVEDRLQARLTELGYGRLRPYRLPGNFDAMQLVAQMRDDGVDVAVLATPAITVARLLVAAGSQRYGPSWVGLDDSVTDALAGFACQYEQDLTTFAPTPGLDVVADLDPDFALAVEVFAPDTDQNQRHVMLGLWNIMRRVHQTLDAAGPDPDRDGLLAVLPTFAASGGAWPGVDFAASRVAGTASVHRLEPDCASGTFTTPELFVDTYEG